MLPEPLARLAAWPQFVAWRVEMRLNTEGKLVPTKVPYSPRHGGGADSTKPSDWGSYEDAVALRYRANMAGVGFVFTPRDPFFFVDIDKALEPSGNWSDLAKDLCIRFGGAAVEVSQSGTGLHIIGSCTKDFIHRNKHIASRLELYTQKRFVALTGLNAVGNVGVNMDHALPALVAQYFTRDPREQSAVWSSEPVPEWRGPEDDAELVAKAMTSGGRGAAAAFGDGGVTFADLFSANVDVLSRKWPRDGGYDASSADQALANQLAFWTGKNCERIERIMRLSSLARAKWDQHHTYLETTVTKAAGFVTSVYHAPAVPPERPPPPPERVVAAGFKLRDGAPLMLSGTQLDYFAECIYVTSINRALVPGGALLDQARFDVQFGGYEFVIARDGKKTSTSAWEAFTRNQNFEPPMADRACFRPEEGVGNVVMDSGKLLANTYYPAETEETEGDPSPMLDHIFKMLPDGQDAELLLTYMASVKQNPGMKAQWWPVVQGAQGNFKSFLLRIMSFAVGNHYSHLPNMKKMVDGKSNFNGWADRKLFLGLDEVYAANRREFFEGFKTTVTNLEIPIEGKGVEELTGDNRANGMIVTNHQDGVPIVDNDRRYAVFFCAQQTKADMARDGMDALYIRNLKDWLLGSGIWKTCGPSYGLRVMNWWLTRKTLDPELDPNQLCVHCPMTTSTGAAIIAGRGRVEQEVQEAIEEERVGFAGGWVSSLYLDRLLKELSINVPPTKRRDLLLSLGYEVHPAFPDGRVPNLIGPDNGKPRLYVPIGTAVTLSPLEATKAYTTAQNKAASDRSTAGKAFNG